MFDPVAREPYYWNAASGKERCSAEGGAPPGVEAASILGPRDEPMADCTVRVQVGIYVYQLVFVTLLMGC